MPQLKNKIAVVTGGISGIGLATAKRFVEEGAYVFTAGRRQAELDKAVAEIGSNVTGVKTDISKLDDLDRLYETVAKKGKIDVIFAGAAFVEKAMTPGATPELSQPQPPPRSQTATPQVRLRIAKGACNHVARL